MEFVPIEDCRITRSKHLMETARFLFIASASAYEASKAADRFWDRFRLRRLAKKYARSANQKVMQAYRLKKNAERDR